MPATPKMQAESTEISKEDIFFFDNVFIQVENKLFCVPKQGFLEPKSVFADMNSLPQGGSDENESQVDGSRVDCPLVLAGISPDKFRALLRVMYPFTRGYGSMTQDDWVGALHLADMWGLHNARATVIKSLTPILETRDCDKILLGEKYNVSAWYFDGFANIVARPTIPTVEELIDGGLDTLTIAHIFRLREMIRMNRPMNGKYEIRPSAGDCQWTSIDCIECAKKALHHCKSTNSQLESMKSIAQKHIQDLHKDKFEH